MCSKQHLIRLLNSVRKISHIVGFYRDHPNQLLGDLSYAPESSFYLSNLPLECTPPSPESQGVEH